MGLSHLARRFLAVLRARPLTAEEERIARSWLGEQLQGPFFGQPPADQRHGVEAARHVIAAGIDDPDAVIAALTHDIGKRHARLGALGRVIATLMIKARLPLPARFRVYRDHGLLAAEELEAAGAPALAVAFARHHHGARPVTIDQEVWRILVESDQPAKTWGATGAGISSSRT